MESGAYFCALSGFRTPILPMESRTFRHRHIGPRTEDLTTMLRTIGAETLDQLIDETVPENIRLRTEMALPEPLSEREFLVHAAELAERNQRFKTYIGQGYYGTVLPGPIQRNILENPGWYTAYTPYQAEIAQGRLEALLNYQTMVCEVTGMPLANASLLDEGTAAAEAMAMFYSARPRTKTDAHRFFASRFAHPQTLDVLRTRAVPLGIELVEGDPGVFAPDSSYFGALIQYPDTFGRLRHFGSFIETAQALEIQVCVASDLMALCLYTPPGEWGADCVVGTSQRFGIPLGYGGPHAAFFACREDYKRHVPGRIIGRTLDTDGKPALRMALQTREQHIKRDKATSNICTAQVLLSVMAGMYAVYHGPDGLRTIAAGIRAKAHRLDAQLKLFGYHQTNPVFFDTLHLEMSPAEQLRLQALALEARINLRYFADGSVGISLDEATTESDLADLIALFSAHSGINPGITTDTQTPDAPGLERQSDFLTHPVFRSYQSETELMRYIKKLERKDLSLNHSMIPLGSCTMKLNAATEMIPLSWPGFAEIHPFVPREQAQGYGAVIEALEKHLAVITGFDAVSLQPNSGAQGEYAGLMVIRAYHQNRGEGHRNIALIPSSAHGTNPASAVMAGMKVVVVQCDALGNVDLADLEAKCLEHGPNLAGLMVTYPSTHGVFESAIVKITDMVHAQGGQVYMDGANMNAQVGLTSPGLIGADVCHLNLHKTFAIPHGGGGPGMGPICVKAHLAPFLPGHEVVHSNPEHKDTAINAISAAPWGSGLILLISYAYIRMLGSQGLTDATRYAILNANYIKARLDSHYDVLYVGEQGRAAHEMILDCRPFKKAGVEVTDIAKRLMDYGYHAPTVSFPVAGTMMVEPTESESRAELDHFCDAMIAIRAEIDALAEGRWEAHDNPLKNAPHTLEMLTADVWPHSYSRETAAFPLHWIRDNKFWPSVRRVDDAYGDRNLACTCAPMEAYQS